MIVDNKLHEECGVFGIYNVDGLDAVNITYIALHALQHRGQDGAGIATTDGFSAYYHKDTGLVTDVFDAQTMEDLRGKKIAMGHVRYATSRSSLSVLNTQPIVMHSRDGFVSIAHNGRIVNSGELRRALLDKGQLFQTEVDAEILLHLIAQSSAGDLTRGIQRLMKEAMGAYALVIMTQDQLIGVRDPWGIRPLALGRIGENWMLASESCAFDSIGAEYVREVAPGEMIIIDQSGMRSMYSEERRPHSMCVFEYVYFARSDSCMEDIGVFASRKRMGELLSKAAPVDADVVAGVPDSAIASAMGYAEASGIPYGQLLIKNRYTGRTFITPGQASRERGVRMKLSTLRDQCKGKRVILVDDSIVRGTNSRQLVNMLRQAGAKEVHMRIASPPVINPCYFGINTPSVEQLISAQQGVEQVRELIGADSLVHLSLDDLKRAVDPDGRCGFCDACFSGNYPMPVSADFREKSNALEHVRSGRH